MSRTKIFILAVYIICALPVCLTTLSILPPGFAPDEPFHLARAEGLLHGAILATRKTKIDSFTRQPANIVGVKIDRGLLAVMHFPGTETLADMNTVEALPPDHKKVFYQIPNTARYFPIAYVPGTLGLAAGLALHLSPYVTILLGRACMMLAFLILGGLALWVTTYGEVLLLTILLTPMTLELGGSFNEDGILCAMTCLAAALLTRPSTKRRYGALALLAGVVCAKLPYALLLAAAAFPLSGPGTMRRLREVAIAYLPVLLWAFITAAFVAVTFGRAPYHPGPLYAGDRSIWLDHTSPAMSLQILLHPPERLFSIVYITTKYYMRFFLRQIVEGFGPFLFPPPTRYDWAWGITYASALLGLIFHPRPERPAASVVLQNCAGILALIGLTYWVMVIMLYMDASFVGDPLLVYGVQGRYFLLFLPLLVLAIPGWRGRFTLPVWLPALPVIAIGIVDCGYLPLKLVNAYYLH